VDTAGVKREAAAHMSLAVRARSHRSPEERLGVRFPGAFAYFARGLFRLVARSRLRHALLRRAAQHGFEAYNRRDFAALFLYYHPDFEEIAPRQLVEVGFEPVYRGHHEAIRYRQQWGEEWGEFDVKPEELFDLGDNRLLVIGRAEGRSPRSSVPLTVDWCFLLTVSAGRVSREELFFDRGEAFRAAGLEG
jgi:ketosteroid isomerase-like protein